MKQSQVQTKRIKLLMIKKGLKVKDLAEQLGVSDSAMSNAVNGRRVKLQKKAYEYLKSL